MKKLAITITSIVVIIIIFVVLSTTNIDKLRTGICLTHSCNRAASAILDYMDPDINPCDDFYKFVCGNFLKKDLPEETLTINWFTTTYQKVLQETKIVLEEPLEKQDELPPLRHLYKACMNTTEIEENSLKKMQAILKNLGGWPVVDIDKWKDFHWIKSAENFNKEGLSTNYFVEFSLLPLDVNPLVVHLNQPSLGLEREYLVRGMSDKVVKAYYDYMVNIAVLLGNDKEKIAETLKESLSFEIELANITIPNKEIYNTINSPRAMTTDEIKRKIPDISWWLHFRAHLGLQNIGDDEKVIVSVFQYFVNFEALIKRTSKRALSNYAMWRAMNDHVSYMPETFRDTRFKFLKVLLGPHKREERWEECIGEMFRKNFWNEFAVHFVRKVAEAENRDASQIVENVAKFFQDALHSTNWMDQQTKKYTLNKATSMIVSLEKNIDLSYVYRWTHVDEIKYFETSVKFSQSRRFSGRSTGRYELPRSIEASYIHKMNRIGDSLLRSSFFEANRPQYLNYAGLGFLVAHEMAHGFDDEGGHHLKDGRPSNWWSTETEKLYWEKVRCLIEQYGNYTVPELNLPVDGVNTLRENLADGRGIEVAYLAYRRWTEKHWVEKRLPGMKHTPNQMFWIYSAHLLCDKSKPEFLSFKNLVDEHSPSRYRVIGALSNTKYFAQDFDCPIGSGMNPENKCKMW